MTELVSGVVVIACLVGILWFILGSMRSGHGAAKTLKGLNRYGEPQPWATAMLGGLAVAAIATTISGPGIVYAGVALGVGAACGMGDRKDGVVQHAAGLVGALAALCASYRFVAGSGSGLWLNLILVIGLGVLFLLLGVFRRRPYQGLAWFAVVDIMAFLLSPLGGSLLDLPDLAAYGSLGLAMVVTVGLALVAEALLNLFAAAVALASVAMAAFGWTPDLTAQLTYVALALVAFAPIALVRRRLAERG